MTDQVQAVTLKIQKNQGLTQALLAHVKEKNMKMSDGSISGAEWNATVDKLAEIQAKRKEANQASIFTGGTEKNDWHHNFVVQPDQEITFTAEEMKELYETMGVSFSEEAQGAEGNEEAQGNQEAQGAEGNEEAQGNQEAQGAEGNEEAQGNQEAQGAEGNEEAQGNQEAQGAEGDEGAQSQAFTAEVGAPSRYHRGFTIKEVYEDGTFLEESDKYPNT